MHSLFDDTPICSTFMTVKIVLKWEKKKTSENRRLTRLKHIEILKNVLWLKVCRKLSFRLPARFFTIFLTRERFFKILRTKNVWEQNHLFNTNIILWCKVRPGLMSYIDISITHLSWSIESYY